ncbi:hypothetical protein BD779DRAFT_1680936 [Infundibulicybe gibba]|nr:hypothetical protein BD779DRAFT_1680936 [Infundibulicybe gibba]
MSSQCTPSVDSIPSVPIFASAEFLSMYNNDSISTDALSDKALIDIIKPNGDFLRAADPRYQLDDFLSALLTYAPHQLGKRYVTVALHTAYDKGIAAVVDVAKLWMDHLFLPLLVIANETTKDPYLEGDILREKVSIRQQYRCAFTQAFDAAHAGLLRQRRLCAPDGAKRLMVVTHIIPPVLSYADKAATSSEIDPTCMREIFLSWTGISPDKLAESRMNSPANTVLATIGEDVLFGEFGIYLDKAAHPNVPNKYRVGFTKYTIMLSDGTRSADVELRTGEKGIESPDPEFLAIHAAIAQVVDFCGAAAYVQSVKWDAESGVDISQNSPMDFSTMLHSRLAVLCSQ